MAQYIYDFQQLATAIADTSTRDISVKMAEDFLYRSYVNKGLEGIYEAAAENGINAVFTESGDFVYWSTYGMEGATDATAPLIYDAALDVTEDAITHEVVFETSKSVTTGAGEVLAKGGLKTAAKGLAIVGAVATGCQLGWESYKEHPDVWTDLSNSIFNTDDPNTPVDVLVKVGTGGYTTAVHEKTMAHIIQKLAAAGCFEYTEYDSETTGTGLQPVTVTSVGLEGVACGLAYDKAGEYMAGGTVLQILADYETQDPNTHADIIVGSVTLLDSSDFPTTATFSRIAQNPPGVGEWAYFAPIQHCTTVTCTIVKSTGAYTFNVTQNHTPGIYSGVYYDANGRRRVGGLNINKTVIPATNPLFPYILDSLNLPPTCTAMEALDELNAKNPDWLRKTWIKSNYDPTTKTYSNDRYYPITVPWWDPTVDTTKDPDYDAEEAQKGKIYEEPDPKSKPQVDEILDIDPIAPTPVPFPTPDPTPDPPIPVNPSSDRLWSVYNPDMSELNDLGAYLWSSSIIDILAKFVQNPMDAIISLHKIYCTPTTGAAQHIALGYLDSGVSADTVTEQFEVVDCGSVTIGEYFGDARDYDAPYTQIECYLPFIGMVRLHTPDIMGGVVNIKYYIDVYSGACLACIYVTKLGVKQLLYNYTGNCSVQIPLTGADRTRLLSGAVSGATTGAVAGGPLGAAVGAVAGAWTGGTSIQRAGGFSSNAGCLGVKKPYILVTRKYAYDAGSYNSYYGFPSNNAVRLGNCKGFTRVRVVHIENMGRATNNEKTEIENLLKQGVIIK